MQLDVMLLLKRISEHFASSSLSLFCTRAFHAVRVIIPACIACIADVVMRKAATDYPSKLCLNLMGKAGQPGFGLSTGMLGPQSETIEVHTAELCAARTAVLDYFDAQASLKKIWSWEQGMEPSSADRVCVAMQERTLSVRCVTALSHPLQCRVRNVPHLRRPLSR